MSRILYKIPQEEKPCDPGKEDIREFRGAKEARTFEKNMIFVKHRTSEKCGGAREFSRWPVFSFRTQYFSVFQGTRDFFGGPVYPDIDSYLSHTSYHGTPILFFKVAGLLLDKPSTTAVQFESKLYVISDRTSIRNLRLGWKPEFVERSFEYRFSRNSGRTASSAFSRKFRNSKKKIIEL